MANVYTQPLKGVLMISNVEYWVMRVITKQEFREMSALEMARRLEAGTLTSIGRELCEPLECCDSEVKAIDIAKRQAAMQRGEYKIVMNAEVEV